LTSQSTLVCNKTVTNLGVSLKINETNSVLINEEVRMGGDIAQAVQDLNLKGKGIEASNNCGINGMDRKYGKNQKGILHE
jgi:hypothetical protein